MVTPAEGETLSNLYRLGQVIGTGGMGVVFRARQLNVERDVAVKIMHSHLSQDERAIKRFENEVRAISQLRHPNTLRLYDCQRDEAGHLFIVTELLSGGPLSLEIERSGPLDVARVIRVLDSVCRSLSEAHAAGIVHRDLKPENVFIDRVGSEDVVKVLDFGVAKLLESRDGVTQPGAICGTPQYMAPEQIKAEPIDHRTDIYALGAVTYEMLTGQPPFAVGHAFEIFHQHLTEPPPEIARPIAPELRALVLAMLEKDPAKRPQSVDEIRRRLPDPGRAVSPSSSADLYPDDEFSSEHLRTERAPMPTTGHAMRRPVRRWVIVASALLVIAALPLLWLLQQVPKTPATPEQVEVQPPAREAPKVEAPQVQAPKVEPPKVEPPKVEPPKARLEPKRIKAAKAKKKRPRKPSRTEKPPPPESRWDRPLEVDL